MQNNQPSTRLKFKSHVKREWGLEPVQLRRKFPILKLWCLYLLGFLLPLPLIFKIWCAVFEIQCVSTTLCPCFSLMERSSLIQRFRYIISLASLAYTFTILHTIQYSMQDHDDDNSTSRNLQDHDLTLLEYFAPIASYCIIMSKRILTNSGIVRGRSTSSDVSSDISPSPLYIPPHRRQPKMECTHGSDTRVRWSRDITFLSLFHHSPSISSFHYFFIILLFPLRFLVYRHASHLSRALSHSPTMLHTRSMFQANHIVHAPVSRSWVLVTTRTCKDLRRHPSAPSGIRVSWLYVHSTTICSSR